MSDLQVVTFKPEADQYAWTFGGVPPVARIKPPVVLEVFTEDAFFGRVRSENDLVSQVCEFPFVNPQTGPFYIEGAEPGDTLAVHFVSITPARDWGASTTIPLFGSLTEHAPDRAAQRAAAGDRLDVAARPERPGPAGSRPGTVTSPPTCR